ncbi:MAG: molybdenum cofactor biosynthesis protein MoaE [Desulfurococcaceae archaeon]
MKIIIKSFSIIRDVIGEHVELDFERPITIKELIELIRDKYNVPKDIELLVILNNRIASEDQIIDRDSVIYITPPFSGGGRVIDVKILREKDKPDFNAIIRDLTHLDKESGALAIFIGFVKGKIGDKEVHELEYDAIDELAIKQLEKIAREEADNYGLSSAVIWHYVGRLKPGDITLVIATTSNSRESAINAMRKILERVKKEVPVFKLERRSDGDYWVVGDGIRYKRPGK